MNRVDPLAAARVHAPESTNGRTVPGWDVFAVGVCGVILAAAWRIQELYPILATLQFPKLMVLLAIGALVFNRDPRRSLKYLRHPLTLLILAIFVIALVSILTSLWPSRSFAFIRRDYAKTILMFVLVAASVRAFVDVERLAGILVLGAALYSFNILTRFQIGGDGRLSNLLYYDANDLAMMIVCTIPLAVYFVSRYGSWIPRVLGAVALALFLLTIVKTGSRGGFLGLLGVGVFFLFGFRAIPRRIRIGAIAFGVMLFSVFATEQYWGIMRTLLNPQDDYNWAGQESDGRMEIWKRGIGYMIERPLLGVGPDAFGVAEGTLSPLVEETRGIGLRWAQAHNSFVQIGAELGFIALLLFITLLVYAYRSGRRMERAPPLPGAPPAAPGALGNALAGSIVGYAVAGFFLSQGYAIYLYMILATLLGLAKLQHRRTLQQQPARLSAAAQPVRRRRSEPVAGGRSAAQLRQWHGIGP